MSDPAPAAARDDPARSALCVPGRNCWRLARASRVAFLIDADAYFTAFAEAVAHARESVFVIGWDIQASARLRPGPMPNGWPNTLREYLGAALTARPELHAYLLDWDFSLVFALERELLPVVQLGWLSHPRLHFCLDGEHPLTGCHHQKLVVVDDAVAFAGGLDLTTNRWDTPAHRLDDPRRRLPNGKPYGPFHDVQVAFSGEAARAVARLARARWERATGERVPAVTGRHDPWPPDLAPDLRDVDVAIARTEPAHDGRPQVNEVVQLYLDSIGAARRWIYVENQYFTSAALAEAMAARLAEDDGPEIVLVGPRVCAGWLEERTMGIERARLLARLQAADRHGRLRVYHPRLPGNGDLNVHAKVMIVDDALVRVGSSNLSNRSMGLDTECDVAIEPRDAARIARGIAALRDRLVAEHLGVLPREVATTLAQTGSLIATIERLAGGARTLVAPSDTGASARVVGLGEIAPVDLERPVAHAPFVVWLPPGLREPLVRGAVRGLRALAGVGCTALAWRAIGLGAFLAGMPMALTLGAMAGVCLLGSALQVPIAALHTVSALALGPHRGTLYAIAASGTVDLLGFALGSLLPQERRARVAGRYLGPLSRLLVRGRARDVALLRLSGAAPFPTVAIVAGASRVPAWRFLAGAMCVTIPSAALTAFVAWVLGG